MKLSEDLRRSVLQAAIQGKLTEQRAEDGNAKKLLYHIRQEKEKLIASGKLKKEKPLPMITDEEKPFEIPESWEWVKLGDCFSITMGQSPEGKYINDSEGIEFHQGKIFFGDRVIADSKIKTSVPTKIASADSVLLCVRAPVGKVNITDREVCIGRGLAALKCYCKMPTLFLYFMLQNLESVFNSKATGTTFKAITLETVYNQVFPLPPLAEQKRIVERVEAIMSKLDELEKAENELEALKKKFPGDMRDSLLQAAIQGKLTEQRSEDGNAKDLLYQIRQEKEKLIAEGKLKKEKPLPMITDKEKPFEIPDSWEWVRWGDLSFSLQYGYNAPALKNGIIKMVRISDIQDNKIQWSTVPYCEISDKEIQNYILTKNDILFARTGGTVGKSYLVTETPEKAIYAGYLIRTRFSDKINPQFIKFFMGSNLYWIQLRNGTVATAQPNCNGQTLSKMIVPLPPLAEQKRIVERLNELLPLCEDMKGEYSV